MNKFLIIFQCFLVMSLSSCLDNLDFGTQTDTSCSMPPSEAQFTNQDNIDGLVKFDASESKIFEDCAELSITEFNWDFGDGQTHDSSHGAVEHQYLASGTYLVSLRIKSGQNEIKTTKSITVEIEGITCTTQWRENAFSAMSDQLEVVFDAQEIKIQSSQDCNYYPATTYSWDFGDGKTMETTLTAVDHTYAQMGTYNVTLTASNDDGEVEVSQNVSVSGGNVCDVEPSPLDFETSINGLGANFDASHFGFLSSNHCSNSLPTLYVWDFGDGNTIETTSGIADHLYAQSGTYLVQLTASDDTNQATVSKQVEVNSYICEIAILPFEIASTVNDLSVNVDASALRLFSNDHCNQYEPTTFLWNFGDGNVVNGPNALEHTYAIPGTYVITLQALADDHSAQYSIPVQVNAPSKELAITSTQTGNGQAMFTLSHNYTQTELDQLELIWVSSNGQTVTGESFSVSFFEYGDYEITLNIIKDGMSIKTLSEDYDYNVNLCNVPPYYSDFDVGIVGIALYVDASSVSIWSSQHCGIIEIDSYIWDFGDGSESVEIQDTQFRHTYVQAGTYIIQLIAQSGDTTQMFEKTITIEGDVSTELTIVADAIIPNADSVEFSVVSSNPDFVIEHYHWVSEDNVDFNPTFTPYFADKKEYIIDVTVTSSQGSTASASLTYEVMFDYCSYAPIYIAPPSFTTEKAGQTAIKFTINSDDNPCVTNPVYVWDFGDGLNPAEGTEFINEYEVIHTYQTNGEYVVSVWDGQSSPYSQVVSVIDDPECHSIGHTGFNVTSIDGLTAYFDASESSGIGCDGDLTGATYYWDYGDGTIGESQTAQHSYTYSSAGTYDVKLSISRGLLVATEQVTVFNESNTAELFVNHEESYDIDEINEVVVVDFTASAFVAYATDLLDAPTESVMDASSEIASFEIEQALIAPSELYEYHWDFGNEETVSTYGYSSQVSHEYDVFGQSVTVVLTVTEMTLGLQKTVSFEVILPEFNSVPIEYPVDDLPMIEPY